MREILFKAKRIDNGEWVHGYYVKGGRMSSVIFTNIDSEIPECFDFEEIDETTLCQYTGLTDKNGNKIWENDVVLSEPMWQAKVVYGEYNCNCCHGVYGWNFEPVGDYHECCDIRKPDTVKVIGNIFDN